MKSFRFVARRMLWSALPLLTLIVWFWAAIPTSSFAREAPPVRYEPLQNNGGGDEPYDYRQTSSPELKSAATNSDSPVAVRENRVMDPPSSRASLAGFNRGMQFRQALEFGLFVLASLAAGLACE